MKKPRFSKDDWELIEAYAHGYAYGCANLVLKNLWQKDEAGYAYEYQGWCDGLNFIGACGALEGEEYDWEQDEN
jgi:hypothetical protein